MTKDLVVHPSAPMPKGYTFVSKGNVYITAHCRSATYAANKPLYVVSKKAGNSSTASVLGLRCPIHIAKAVREDERASRSTRLEATTKRDGILANVFRDALVAAYPDTPRDLVPQVVKHAMAKRQGRVARTGTLELDQRVRLAVRAHIRHCHTNYDALLQGTEKEKDRQPKPTKGQLQNGVSREEARRLTLGQVDQIERVWAAKAPKPSGQKPTRKSGRAELPARKERKERKETAVPKSSANRVQKTTATSSPSPTRPTRLSKSAAASRIAQCLRSPRGGRGDISDAIVIDSSSDEETEDAIVVSSDIGEF